MQKLYMKARRAAFIGNPWWVTWKIDHVAAAEDYGGDSSAVQEQLRDVQCIQACDLAFAAVLADGSIVTWGLAPLGAR